MNFAERFGIANSPVAFLPREAQAGSQVFQADGHLAYLAEAEGRERSPPNLPDPARILPAAVQTRQGPFFRTYLRPDLS